MTARALLFVPALLLTACASQRPYDEFGICLTDTEDLADLKAVDGVSAGLAQKVYDHFHEKG